MSFNKDRRGGHRGRGKRDEFGGDMGGFEPAPYGGGGDRFGGDGDRFGGGGDRFGGGGDRFGGGGGGGDRFGGGGGFGGGNRGGGGGGFGGGPRGGGMPAQVVGEGTGQVKFFNPEKGFGFIARDDGGEDVFVHISAVEQAGLQGLASGQPLGFTLVERNGKVSATEIKIDGEPMPVDAPAPRREGGFGDRGGAGGGFGGGGFGGERPGGARGRRQLTGERTTGTVKFFNGTKGFGFISRDDGQPDAFVHISAVQRANMQSLMEGDRLAFDIEVDDRGKFAAVNLAPQQD